MPSSPTRVAVVGAGPRGIAMAWCLLDPQTRAQGELEVHLIDPEPGGAVWRTDQDRPLLMNSRGGQATVFLDESVPGVTGPDRGPSFVQWCHQVAPDLDLPAEVAVEAAAMTQQSFARRRLFGYYTRWAIAELGRQSPDLRVHRRRVLDLTEEADGQQRVHLDDASHLDVEAAVLTLGHLPAAPGAGQKVRADFARRHRLTYVPAQPATSASLTALPPGTPTALLGAGLNFYDVMALVTEGRGGRYTTRSDGSLEYRPSGQEPQLLVGSGRGVPYMARSDHPLPVHLSVCTDEVQQSWLRAEGTLSFRDDVWPVLVAELERTWRASGGEGELDIDALLDPFGARVAPGSVRSVHELTAQLRAILLADVASASATPRGALTAVAETLAALKDRVRGVAAVGAFDGGSVREDLQGWFRSAGAYVAAGPPLERVRQAVALIDAGLLRAVGAHATCELDDQEGAFLIRSRELAEPVAVTALVEARLAPEDTRHTDDQLVQNLQHRGLGRTVQLPAAHGPLAFGGMEVVRTTPQALEKATACRLVDSAGRPNPRRYLIGLPVQPQEWNIANLPQPRRGDRLFVQARSVVAQIESLRRRRPSADAPHHELEESTC